MKNRLLNFSKTLVLVCVVFISLGFGFSVLAQEEITSPNFKIVTPTLNSGGGASSSSSFSFYSSLGEISDPKLTSASYSMLVGTPNTFLANVPVITCFETNTNSGTSLCNSSYPNLDGTRGEFGEGGYYDRAKFVIDSQSNPSDTLYGIQISTDNFVTVQYIDGTTRQPVSTKDVANYLTKSQWESSPWNSSNIIGLTSLTGYKIRITALHGDLTESSPGPEASATTTTPSITFDLDIGNSSWPNSIESASPYSVSLGTMSAETVITASNRIYLDIGSNAVNGVEITVSDLNNGLKSTSASTTITSPTAGAPSSSDLDAVTNGFGIKVSNVNTSTPSSLVRDADYYSASFTNRIGRLKSVGSDTVLTTPTGINTGRAQIEVKVKIPSTTPIGGDYTDIITFAASGNF